MPERTETAAEVAEVDLLEFERGGRKYAADAAEVVRIARVGSGNAGDRARTLVIRRGGVDAQVPVDRLIGVRRVNGRALRPLPAFLRGLLSREFIGFAVEGKEILMLVDLEALVDVTPVTATRTGKAAAAPAP